MCQSNSRYLDRHHIKPSQYHTQSWKRFIHRFINCSFVFLQGASQKFELLNKKGKSFLQVRKIKEFDEDFSVKTFPDEAQDLYIRAHELLQK